MMREERIKILITGGAGFIGSALVRHLINNLGHEVLNFDKLTYAGNSDNLLCVSQSENYTFIQGDICDFSQISLAINNFKPDLIFHLAAETHVDRSINGAKTFIDTNINGTFNVLEATRQYFQTLEIAKRNTFRLLHISTDEVYGSLGETGLFHETTAYDPSSPYSASKAASDHLAKAWHRTYGLPIVISNCSNNYGPYQFPEKLIPLNLINAIEGKKIQIYGDGKNIRDWLYVDDHVRALYLICTKGRLGETYNVGGNNERTNLEIIHKMCEILNQKLPREEPYQDLIQFVKDRPGHDRRYAINANKLRDELGFVPSETFQSGMEKTVNWYLDNKEWWQKIRNKNYDGARLGLLGE